MVFDAVVTGLGDARAAAVVVPVVIGAVVRRWLHYREAVQREAERTRQVSTVIAGTESRHRAEVMTACEWLRAGPDARGNGSGVGIGVGTDSGQQS
ncbi:hypothetical protein AB0D10_31990 [Kitasatospora sp. NPDC048545]|uniref:hypothetical protein n=1 Tax=Kitasatospora sp. NPDC048545 TaxID=3157208 RepID=UPI0033EDA2E9